MATWASTARVEAPARPRPRRAAQVAPQRRLAGSVVWIALLGFLLVGVVAVNVAVLRLNMRIEELGQQRLDLQAENALFASKVSSAVAPPRIEQRARNRLGFVPAADPTYVELRRSR